MRFRIILAGVVLVAAGRFAASVPDEFYNDWSLSRAVKLLNSSAWARHETFTRVVGGIGSGVSGEKEIYNTFYIRFLSARPIRQAYARVQQIHHRYDEFNDREKQQFDDAIRPGIELDFEDWIIVAVSFRSNDPNEENQVRQYFQSGTLGMLKNRAFLSTDVFPQVELAAYFPPREESVGAKFVFPKRIDEVEVVTRRSRDITFELVGVPGAGAGSAGSSYGRSRSYASGSYSRSRSSSSYTSNPDSGLRATFSVKDMVVNGELIL